MMAKTIVFTISADTIVGTMLSKVPDVVPTDIV